MADRPAWLIPVSEPLSGSAWVLLRPCGCPEPTGIAGLPGIGVVIASTRAAALLRFSGGDIGGAERYWLEGYRAVLLREYAGPLDDLTGPCTHGSAA